MEHNREEYEKPTIELVLFTTDEIITTSNLLEPDFG